MTRSWRPNGQRVSRFCARCTSLLALPSEHRRPEPDIEKHVKRHGASSWKEPRRPSRYVGGDENCACAESWSFDCRPTCCPGATKATNRCSSWLLDHQSEREGDSEDSDQWCRSGRTLCGHRSDARWARSQDHRVCGPPARQRLAYRGARGCRPAFACGEGCRSPRRSARLHRGRLRARAFSADPSASRIGRQAEVRLPFIGSMSSE